jgi:hypothetical protein
VSFYLSLLFSPLFFDLGPNHAMFLRLSSTFLGSPSECLYSLRTFGIPTDSLPTIPEEGAKDALRNHYKWCLMRQTKEGLVEKIGISHLLIVDCSYREDCLFGKG